MIKAPCRAFKALNLEEDPLELRELAELGVAIGAEEAERLGSMTDMILEWNKVINVTAIRDRQEFIDKNVIDSLLLSILPEFQAADRILDMGTGGGFPGLPLACVFPGKQFVLVDAVGKKLRVVSDTAEKLGLSNVSVVHARAEDLGRDKAYREAFPLVTSRAVANMSTLCEYCFPFVKKGGYFAAFKTEDSADEIAGASRALSILGGETERTVPDGIEGSGHIFVVVKKTGNCPQKYPRKAGLPSKEPL